MEQARENLGALGWRLSSGELRQLEYAAQESPRKMIQNVFQTRSVPPQFVKAYITFDYGWSTS